MDPRAHRMHLHASLFDRRHVGWGGFGPPTMPGMGNTNGDAGGAGSTSSSKTAVFVTSKPSPTGGFEGNARSTSSTTSSSQATPTPGVGGSGSGSGSGSGGAGNGGDSSAAEVEVSKSGLPPGSIAGIVVGLLALLAILALLLFKFRKSTIVQRMLTPFAKFTGKGSPGGQPNPRDSMGNNLLVAGAGAAAAAGNRTPSPQPPMAEKGTSPVATAATAANPRILTPSPTDQMFAVTTASALSSGGYLSPTTAVASVAKTAAATGAAIAAATAAAAARDTKPLPPPPLHELRASNMTHLSQTSMGSSLSNGSTVLSPSSMTWPMPPTSPPVSAPQMSPPVSPPTTATSPRTPQHRQGASLSSSQWISMEQPGQTVVRINHARRPA